MNTLQAKHNNFKWVSSRAVQDHPNPYAVLSIDMNKAVESWRQSIIAHEWLSKDGAFKGIDALSAPLKTQWEESLARAESGYEIERPILGLGVLDNIEIGTNRSILSVADHLGIDSIEVVVPEGMVKLFKEFTV